MRPIIYPYKLGSRSARALAEELKRRGHRSLRVRPDGRYRPYRNHVIIQWGKAPWPQWGGHPLTEDSDYIDTNLVLNKPGPVGRASNKHHAFRAMQDAGVRIPEFTIDVEEAQRWWEEGSPVVARHTLSGHSGEGIETFGLESDDAPIDAPRAPLYVKYVKKTDEYRVHVFRGQVIDIQQKKRRRDVLDEEVNWQIRNHQNGFIYARDDIDEPHPDVLDQARNAIQALGLDFGAADIIWNRHHTQAYVLEVNTAPGLEGTTVLKYADAIERIL